MTVPLQDNDADAENSNDQLLSYSLGRRLLDPGRGIQLNITKQQVKTYRPVGIDHPGE